MPQVIPSIFVVGAVTADANYRLIEQAGQSFADNCDAKIEGELEFRLGGGAGNCVQAIKALDHAYDTHSNVTLMTRIGLPPAGDLEAEIAHMIVTRTLSRSDIAYLNATSGESAMNFNTSLEHRKGRLIVKQHVDNPSDMSPELRTKICNHASSAKVTFIDPKKSRMGSVAAKAGKRKDTRTVTDWSFDTWPEDPQKELEYRAILEGVDTIMVPDDAIVEGMKNKVRNPEDLFSRLRDEYGIPNILMSNGGEPVRIYTGGKESFIEVEKHEGTKYALAAGDTRSGAVVRALAMGHSTRNAFEIGTRVASHKIKYPGMVWASKIADELSFMGMRSALIGTSLQTPGQFENLGQGEP